MAHASSRRLTRLGTVSTLIDAVVALRRGDLRGGAVLLGAAALSNRIPGFGTLVSLAMRVVRRLR